MEYDIIPGRSVKNARKALDLAEERGFDQTEVLTTRDGYLVPLDEKTAAEQAEAAKEDRTEEESTEEKSTEDKSEEESTEEEKSEEKTEDKPAPKTTTRKRASTKKE